jgi:hypothetical protein
MSCTEIALPIAIVAIAGFAIALNLFKIAERITAAQRRWPKPWATLAAQSPLIARVMGLAAAIVGTIYLWSSWTRLCATWP